MAALCRSRRPCVASLCSLAWLYAWASAFIGPFGRQSVTWRTSTRAMGTQQIALSQIMEDLKAKSISTELAFERLLQEDLDFDELKLKKLRKSLDQSLERGGNEGVLPAISRLLEWEGLESQQEKSQGIQSAKKFPVFFTAFAAVREYCRENSDLFDMKQLGSALELLTKLARKMWAADDRVTGAMSMILNKELMERGEADTEVGVSDEATIGTLGLRRPFQDMARAALDIPNSEMKHVDAVASMAWALAVANIQSASLQIKVAKGIIAHIDKVTPPEIGKLFITMHDMKWFKDENAIAYLTQALVARIQTLKEEDPGLASMLAAKTKEAQEKMKILSYP